MLVSARQQARFPPGWRKVQETTLVSACYRTLSLTDSKRVCAGYRIGRLRVPTDSQVTIVKGGAVDKSGAFAPTYPQSR